MSKLNEGKLLHKEASPTAQTVGNKLFGDSGVMTYRVMLQTAAGGVTRCDVDASTGDHAAELALQEFFGSRVMSINPAPPEAQSARKERTE